MTCTKSVVGSETFWIEPGFTLKDDEHVWKEKLDKKSDKFYYVNQKTNEKKWILPGQEKGKKRKTDEGNSGDPEADAAAKKEKKEKREKEKKSGEGEGDAGEEKPKKEKKEKREKSKPEEVPTSTSMNPMATANPMAPTVSAASPEKEKKEKREKKPKSEDRKDEPAAPGDDKEKEKKRKKDKTEVTADPSLSSSAVAAPEESSEKKSKKVKKSKGEAKETVVADQPGASPDPSGGVGPAEPEAGADSLSPSPHERRKKDKEKRKDRANEGDGSATLSPDGSAPTTDPAVESPEGKKKREKKEKKDKKSDKDKDACPSPDGDASPPHARRPVLGDSSSEFKAFGSAFRVPSSFKSELDTAGAGIGSTGGATEEDMNSEPKRGRTGSRSGAAAFLPPDFRESNETASSWDWTPSTSRPTMPAEDQGEADAYSHQSSSSALATDIPSPPPAAHSTTRPSVDPRSTTVADEMYIDYAPNRSEMGGSLPPPAGTYVVANSSTLTRPISPTPAPVASSPVTKGNLEKLDAQYSTPLEPLEGRVEEELALVPPSILSVLEPLVEPAFAECSSKSAVSQNHRGEKQAYSQSANEAPVDDYEEFVPVPRETKHSSTVGLGPAASNLNKGAVPHTTTPTPVNNPKVLVAGLGTKQDSSGATFSSVQQGTKAAPTILTAKETRSTTSSASTSTSRTPPAGLHVTPDRFLGGHGTPSTPPANPPPAAEPHRTVVEGDWETNSVPSVESVPPPRERQPGLGATGAGQQRSRGNSIISNSPSMVSHQRSVAASTAASSRPPAGLQPQPQAVIKPADDGVRYADMSKAEIDSLKEELARMKRASGAGMQGQSGSTLDRRGAPSTSTMSPPPRAQPAVSFTDDVEDAEETLRQRLANRSEVSAAALRQAADDYQEHQPFNRHGYTESDRSASVVSGGAWSATTESTSMGMGTPNPSAQGQGASFPQSNAKSLIKHHMSVIRDVELQDEFQEFCKVYDKVSKAASGADKQSEPLVALHPAKLERLEALNAATAYSPPEAIPVDDWTQFRLQALQSRRHPIPLSEATARLASVQRSEIDLAMTAEERRYMDRLKAQHRALEGKLSDYRRRLEDLPPLQSASARTQMENLEHHIKMHRHENIKTAQVVWEYFLMRLDDGTADVSLIESLAF